MCCRNPSTAGPNNALRHTGTVAISRAPRSEFSGSVQSVFSTMLQHDGFNSLRSTGRVNAVNRILEATIK
jgi:hypothetical protein